MTDQPTLIALCGMPGSGKSTWAAQQHGVSVVSCDAVRAGRDPAAVFNEAHARARKLLTTGGVVVFDACSLRPSARTRLLQLGRAMAARCELVFFCTCMLTCASRNAARGQPADVDWIALRSQARAAFRAVKSEGWDKVSHVPCADPHM